MSTHPKSARVVSVTAGERPDEQDFRRRDVNRLAFQSALLAALSASPPSLLRCARNDEIGAEWCFARRVKPWAQKYSDLQKFGIGVCCAHSGPRKRGVSRSSRHAGRTAVDASGVGAKVV